MKSLLLSIPENIAYWLAILMGVLVTAYIVFQALAFSVSWNF